MRAEKPWDKAIGYIRKGKSRVISLWTTALCLVLVANSALAIEPSFSVTAVPGHRTVIRGQTNLPDGTHLLVTLMKQGGGYAAQSQVVVNAGRFATEAFTDAPRVRVVVASIPR